ncbi:aldehyde ferredoxin oxidoreductase family protein [Thioalkalivibrio sp. HK1]|uniref:aldehyde ferredoxin oxidoreductase family protein n=1 Tax=Thioalkalivibrio sp. HK1 TaxID=1469245 RepID=UPI00046FC1CF|nr:aldehyde ferredoxin oxidoreductase family protein [Thioalkalivibrio sp. HK1]
MGWQKRILRVDLTAGTCTPEPLNMEWAQAYLGERGLAAKYLKESMDPKADPLSPENVLIFATGPLTGTMASTSGRYAVVTKGPLTGAIACSNSGGKFGAELKFAGYDLLIIHGRAERPVYLHIVDDKVEIVDAEPLWGKSVWETERWLRDQHRDPQIKVASIGVAGERLVRYACVINDLHRAAGRSGVGAVMGSKNLKAVAARGTKGVRVDDPRRFMEAVSQTKAVLWDTGHRRGLEKYGTLPMIDNQHEFGGLPTRNSLDVQFDGTSKINARAMRAVGEDGHRNLVTNKACFGCTIACGRIAKINPNHYTVVNRKEYQIASGGLEYETAFAFGAELGIDDIDALTFANFIMNEQGMDPISFGGTLAAAMELYEMGVITDADTDGVPLRFGNAQALTIMAEKTGKYEGFGQVLAMGSKLMAEKYGHPEVSITIKGQEIPGYDGRALQGMGLGYATSPRGACHLKHDLFHEDMNSGEITGKGKAERCKVTQDEVAAVDSTGLCLFTTGAWKMDAFARQLDAACEGGWTTKKLEEVGERIFNLERTFNLAAGLTRADDTLPKRFLETPAPSGTAKGKVSELPMMLPAYYKERGWTEEGIPTNETLDRLRL